MAPYYRYKQYMLDRYGAPLYRVPIDLGLGCPHRRCDGSGGCAFCPPDGSRAAQTRGAASIEEQISAGVAFARRRYGAEHFMAYVQAFTGTFASPETQRALFARILDAFPFTAMSIGTRPDCLSAATLDGLAALRASTDLWVEVGVQTVHDATLRRINRGHDHAASRRAIRELAARGIRVAVHVIVGLPGETGAHCEDTAEALSALPIDGIKIHNLHVVRGAALAAEYAERPFAVLDEYCYADILVGMLRRLPPAVAIMRLNTDTAPADLVAPRWSMTKGAFLAHVTRRMEALGAMQGDMLRVASHAEGAV